METDKDGRADVPGKMISDLRSQISEEDSAVGSCINLRSEIWDLRSSQFSPNRTIRKLSIRYIDIVTTAVCCDVREDVRLAGDTAL